MKVAVYQNFYTGEIHNVLPNKIWKNESMIFLGYEERNIEKPKKTVTKETGLQAVFLANHGIMFPPDAKNIRLLYDIEE